MARIQLSFIRALRKSSNVMMGSLQHTCGIRANPLLIVDGNVAISERCKELQYHTTPILVVQNIRHHFLQQANMNVATRLRYASSLRYRTIKQGFHGMHRRLGGEVKHADCIWSTCKGPQTDLRRRAVSSTIPRAAIRTTCAYSSSASLRTCS